MRIKYLFMPDRWKAFIIYLLQTLLLKLDDSPHPARQHEIEQYMYRYSNCWACVKKGTCVESDCHCKMPQRAHVRTDFCPMTKWGPFKTKEAWNAFKHKEQLEFHLTRRTE